VHELITEKPESLDEKVGNGSKDSVASVGAPTYLEVEREGKGCIAEPAQRGQSSCNQTKGDTKMQEKKKQLA